VFQLFQSFSHFALSVNEGESRGSGHGTDRTYKGVAAYCRPYKWKCVTVPERLRFSPRGGTPLISGVGGSVQKQCNSVTCCNSVTIRECYCNVAVSMLRPSPCLSYVVTVVTPKTCVCVREYYSSGGGGGYYVRV
jgi:hypothetical protein